MADPTLIDTTAGEIVAGVGDATVNFAGGEAPAGSTVFIFTMNDAFGASPAAITDYTLIGDTQFDAARLFAQKLAAPASSVAIPKHATSTTQYIIAIYEAADDTYLDAAVVETNGNGTALDLGAVTTATANAMVAAFMGAYGYAGLTASPTGYSAIVTFTSSSPVRLGFGQKQIASPAAEDPGAFTSDGTGSLWGGFTVAIRPASGVVSAALTGTITSTATETTIRTGGATIILTLTGDTWVAAGATFNAQRQAIIDGIDSAQVEAAGWDATVKALQGVAGVVRTSDTVVTITLDAQAGYQITAQETITATIPAAALTLAGAVVAAPTFTVGTITESTGGAKNMLLLGVG